MKTNRPKCPNCAVDLEPERLALDRPSACRSCGVAGLSFPTYYVVLLRLIRIVLSGGFAYAIGLRGEHLVWAAFLIPLPLDLFGSRDLSFRSRFVLATALAYLLGIRSIAFALVVGAMLIPIEMLFRFVARLLPTPKMKIVPSPKCPACGSPVGSIHSDDDSTLICPTCRTALKMWHRMAESETWHEVIAAALVVLFAYSLIHLGASPKAYILLAVGLLYSDLSLAISGSPIVVRIKPSSKATLLNLTR